MKVTMCTLVVSVLLYSVSLSLLLQGGSALQCGQGTVVGMADPHTMTGGPDIRHTVGRGYLLTHAAFTVPCCGVVKQWTFNVDPRSTAYRHRHRRRHRHHGSRGSNPLMNLQVWRPLGHLGASAQQQQQQQQQHVVDQSQGSNFRSGGGAGDDGGRWYRLVGETSLTERVHKRRSRYPRSMFPRHSPEDGDDYHYINDEYDNGDHDYYFGHEGGDSDEDDDDDEDEYDDEHEYEHDDEGGYRVVTVSLSQRQQISVQAGDVIGWQSPRGDIISYTSRYYNLDNVVTRGMREVEVGQEYEFPPPLPSHRTYGIHAVLHSGSPPVIINLPATIEIRDDVREGTVAFNVTAYDANPGDKLAYVVVDNSDDDGDDGDDDGENDLPFEMDTITGSLMVRGMLWRSSYDVTVSVTDPCGLDDVQTLTIRITSPVPPLAISLPRMLTLPVTGGSLHYSHSVVTTHDDARDDVRCQLGDVRPPAPFFSMAGTKLQVKITDDVIFTKDQRAMFTVNVTCADDVRSVTSFHGITLVRHSPPRFSRSPDIVRVPARSSNIGDVIHRVEVTSEEERTVTFLQRDDCDCPFYLHPDGSVALVRSLMSEPVTSYAMDIYVTDGISTIGPSALLLIITDVNHAPQFVDGQPPVSVSVEENSRDVVLSLTVYDADGDDVSVSLRWSPPQAANHFTFNEQDMVLKVRPDSPLDYEDLNRLGLTQMAATIEASDGFMTSSVDVTFTISDVNEPPICLQTSFFVTCDAGEIGDIASDGRYLTSACRDPEALPLSYVILPLRTPSSSPSSSSPPSSSFNSSNDVTNATIAPLFVIDSHNATLIFAASVDNVTSAVFDVSVCDVGRLCVKVEVRVEIRRTPKKPKLVNLPRTIFVAEDVTPGSLLFELEVQIHADAAATDWADDDDDDGEEDALEGPAGDIGAEDAGRVFFAGVPVGDPSLFQLRGKALYLRAGRQLDYEAHSVHVLQLTLENGHVMSDPATLTLKVMDVNEAPVALLDQVNVKAAEGQAGEVILSGLQYMVMDPDLQDNLTFSLLPPSPSFTIHPTSALISLATDYDVDDDVMPREVTLSVKVSDAAQLSAMIHVHVTFLNVNESPRLVNLPREITVPEDVGAGRVIYRVLAEDPDGDDVTLRLSVDEGMGSLFRFNETDGTVAIGAGRGLDFESKAVHVLCFTADDGRLTSSPATLTLLVNDVNEAPYFTRPAFYVSVPEGRAGSVVDSSAWSSSVRDPDGDILTFRLLPGPQSSGFSLDMETAELSFASDFALTRESSPLVVTLILSATDAGGLSAIVHVLVTIYDVNRRPSMLHLPVNVTVPNNTEEGALIYTMYAEDEDDDPLLFRTNSLHLEGRELFDVNSSTGVIRLAGSPGLAMSQSVYVGLQVSVTDGLLTSQAAILGVLLIPHSPAAQKITTSSLPVVTSLLPEMTSTPLGVSSSPYVISVREDELEFSGITLPEDLFKEELATLDSVKQESGPLDSVSYHISGGSGEGYFRIHSGTGNLFFTGNDEIRDGELLPSTLTVDVTLQSKGKFHQHKWTKTVTVEITDVNNHAPEVTSDLLTWFVSRRSKTGTLIGRIKARDQDKGENARLSFQIDVPALSEGTFEISDQGEVHVVRPLGSVAVHHTPATVTVTDSGQPPLSTSLVIFVVFT